MSETKNVKAALLKAKDAFKPIGKNKTGQARGGKYKYADLGNVLEAVEPGLKKENLVLSQPCEIGPGGVMLVFTELTHVTSGESLRSTVIVPNDTTAQELGSWMTYARRYTLCGLLAIVADEDDDGAEATKPKEKKPADKPEDGKPGKPGLSKEQRSALWAYVRSLYADDLKKAEAKLKALVKKEGCESSEQLDPSKFEEYKNRLDAEAKAEKGDI